MKRIETSRDIQAKTRQKETTLAHPRPERSGFIGSKALAERLWREKLAIQEKKELEQEKQNRRNALKSAGISASANQLFRERIATANEKIIQNICIYGKQYFLVQNRHHNAITTYSGNDRVSFFVQSKQPIIDVIAYDYTHQILAVSKIGELFLIDPVFREPETRVNGTDLTDKNGAITKAIVIAENNLLMVNRLYDHFNKQHHSQIIHWGYDNKQQWSNVVYSHRTTIRDIKKLNENIFVTLDNAGKVFVLTLCPISLATIKLTYHDRPLVVVSIQINFEYDGPVQLECKVKNPNRGYDCYSFCIPDTSANRLPAEIELSTSSSSRLAQKFEHQ